jgi:hypothetical protein
MKIGRLKMDALKIKEKTKFINDVNGKPVEVIIPYKVYQELLGLQMSFDIYRQENVQQSIKQAKQDIKNGRVRSFNNMEEAFEWLDRKINGINYFSILC